MAAKKNSAWLSIAVAAALVVLLKVAPLPAFGPGLSGRAGAPAGHPASSQSVANQAFMYIDAFYVDPRRVVPITLLESAFRTVESQYPEVIVDLAADKRSVTVRARGFDRTFDLSILEGSADVARVIDQIVDFVAERLGADVEKDKLLYLAVNGALRELDPHTNIFSMKHFKDFKTSTSGSFGGIGFTFNAADGELTIISPIPDTPASRAGLQSGDKIVFIDGVPTTNMSSDTAVGRMRGEPGTAVTLTIAREGWNEPHDFPIIREIIKIVSVESRLLKGEDGPPVVYARVKNFQTDSSAELAAAIRKLETPAAAGVILDMRDNPGGLLDEAVKLADGFLDEGAIVSTRNRSGRGKVDAANRSDRPFTRLPLIVLVNRGSASAAEIVSAALQDRRALLIGERTFGKGSVQQAFPLSDGGGVLLTVAQYLTPGDVSIQSIGVEPDIALEAVLVSPERLQLAAVKGHMGEADLENAFSTWGNSRREAVASLRFLRTEDREHDRMIDPTKKREERREPSEQEKAAKLSGEFEVRLARRILAAARGRQDAASRAGLLAAAQGVMATIGPEEEQKIGTALAARAIDWSAGSAAAGATAKLVARLPQGQLLKAGEKTGITVAVTNTGSQTLHRVWGRTVSTNPLLKNIDFAFGTIAPGQTREWTAPFEVPGALEERWDTLSLALRAGSSEAVTLSGGSLETKARPAPEYAYRYTLADENLQDRKKSGDGRLEEGERARLTVEVTNRGPAESPLLEVNLSADEKEELFLEEARSKIEKFATGSTKSAAFSFKVIRPLESGKVKVGLSFTDRGAGGFFMDALEIPTSTAYNAGEARVPPQITLAEPVPLATDEASVTLSVSATDDGSVKDIVVYRGEKKMTFARNRAGAAPFPVTLSVPLENGSNRIVVIARDDKDIPAQRVFYVHRRGADAVAAAGAIAKPGLP
ncbi:MAG: S41 family peptidase [Candidatus Methylomirabilia bacterium]